MSARRAALVAALAGALAGCSKRKDAPAVDPGPPPSMPAAELKRGQDACKAYVEKICACAETVEAAREPCKLSKALEDVLVVGTEVSQSPDSTRRDVVQAAQSMRKTIAECIEQTAKLPLLGCP